MTNLALFALMSLVWGATWAAVKVGLADLPPVFLAAARYALAAPALLLLAGGLGDALAPERRGRVLLSGLLINALTYGPLFWGIGRVPSGLAGLLNLALIPVGLAALAFLTGEERASPRHAGALALGLAGLVALFHDRLGGGIDDLAGPAAIVLATLSYCLGSALARPLAAELPPLRLAGVHALVGAPLLALASLALEPVGAGTLVALARPAALASLAFLVVAGTVVGATIYLRLLRDWGSLRAGLYAFVSPVVALAIGAAMFGERVGPKEALGAALLLAAAGVAVLGRGRA